MFGRSQGSQKLEPKAGRSSPRKPARLVLAILFAPVLMLFSAGCAQKQSPAVATMKPHGLSGQAGPDAATKRYAEVELEDDGREAQQPPLMTRKPLADDPTEPFSPNYGRATSWQDEEHNEFEEEHLVSVTPVRATEPVHFQRSIHR